MSPSRSASRSPLPRKSILAAFVVAGLAIAAASHIAERGSDIDFVSPARAADAPAQSKAATAPPAPSAPAVPKAPSGALPTPPVPPPLPEAKDAEPDLPASSAEITIDDKGIRIEHPGSGSGTGRHSSDVAPSWIAPLVFFTVGLVFLVPLFAIGLVVWYKMRRTRMLNETLLRFAEKGVVPPPDALAAIGAPAGMLAAGPAPDETVGAPAYQQAKTTVVRKRAAWSDLRKGILAAAVGAGFALYSIIEKGSASWIGLVLLFVGIGYIVLWYFEERAVRPGGPPAGGA